MPAGDATSPRNESRQSSLELPAGVLRARRSVSGAASLELAEADSFSAPRAGGLPRAAEDEGQATRLLEHAAQEGQAQSSGRAQKSLGLLTTLWVSGAWRVYPTLMLLFMGK